jgi:hypothetical protein
MTLEQFIAIVEGGKRIQAGQSAPPQGLHLTQIRYPEEKIREMND